MSLDANTDAAVAGGIADPFPMYRALRERGPVRVLSARELEALMGPRYMVESDRVVFCLGRDVVERVLRDVELFALAGNAVTDQIAKSWVDETQHPRIRRLAGHAFRPRALQRWRSECVEPLCARLIDRFVADGRAELNAQFAIELPIQVISRILGLPADEYLQFRDAAFAILNIAVDPPRGLEGCEWIRARIGALIEDRRASPGDDLISDLATHADDGDRLSDEEVFDAVVLLILGGTETTFRAIGTAMLALLTHRDELASVLNDPALVPALVEEVLRWDPPAHFASPRVATSDTVLDGHDVHVGDLVLVCLAAANRDPLYYDDPDRFHVRRAPAAPHLSFTVGPHYCLGVHLARMELEVSLRALLARLPNVRLDEGAATPPQMASVGMRGPTHVPVIFDAAARPC